METASKKKSKNESSSSNERGPVQQFREDDVSASVFAREHKGRTFFSVSLSRSYRDGDGQLKFTKNFDAADLSKVLQVVQQVHDYLKGGKE